MAFTPTSNPGTLHQYAKGLVAFEHTPPSSTRCTSNFLLFLGGLNDSLLTVKYTTLLAQNLPASWSLAEIQLSSSGPGWTTSNLNRDADELALAVGYFHGLSTARVSGSEAAPEQRAAFPCGRVVVMGHSTGAQIATTYLVGPWKEPRPSRSVLARPGVAGLIMQAGISDREGAVDALPSNLFRDSLEMARAWVRDGRGEEVLPVGATKGLFEPAPCARRWVSLVDGEGDDDLFSSDLSGDRVERVWGSQGLGGRVDRVLVLLGEEDPYMPVDVDKALLLKTWRGAFGKADGIRSDFDILPAASHNLNESPNEVAEDLCKRVHGFLQGLSIGQDT